MKKTMIMSLIALSVAGCVEPRQQQQPTGQQPAQEAQAPAPAKAPVNAPLVAIDIGHSLKAVGATSTTGIGEFHYNLNIGKQLAAELNARGYRTALIGANGDMTGLEQRPQQAMKLSASVFVSIHHDSAAESDIRQIKYNGKIVEGTTANYGHSIFVSRKDKQNILLGARIGKGFNDNGLTPTSYHQNKRESLNDKRGLYEFGSLRVLKASDIPSALVECGVIKNPKNETELSTPAYQAIIVDSIADGIQSYLAGSAQ